MIERNATGTPTSRRLHRRHCRAAPAPRPAPQRPYDRRTELPRTLPLWPHELDDESPQGRQLILARLRRALRAERRRGVSGHWAYDLSRHVELLRLYRLELAESRGVGNREWGVGSREQGAGSRE
jgi:hypothetical protein